MTTSRIIATTLGAVIAGISATRVVAQSGVAALAWEMLVRAPLPEDGEAILSVNGLTMPAQPVAEHSHAGPTIGYIVQGEIENQVEPDQSAVTTPPMMPYVAVHEPVFVPVSQAAFALDDDLVIGVVQGKTAKAYMALDLGQHGSVDDQMPDGPIEVTWCSACGTGAVFRAELKGRRLHFEYDSMVNANEVHKDVETGSRWQQSTGEAISGPLTGSKLTLYPFLLTTWKAWRTRYPNTMILEPLPGYAERVPVLRPRQKQNLRSGEGEAPTGSFSTDTRLRPREMIAGLAAGNETMAFPLSELRVVRVVNERVGGVPVVVIHQPSSETTTAFEARAKGKVLRFEAADGDASTLIDRETRSTWDNYGLCLKGPLKGTQLKSLILIPEFWFAWSQFRPGTRVFSANRPTP